MRFVIAMLTVLTAARSAQADVESDVAKALADYKARVEKAKADYDKQIGLANRLAVTRLESVATAAARRDDSDGAALAWKRVLILDTKHARARAHFEKNGTLAAVLEEIDGATDTINLPVSAKPLKSGLKFDGKAWAAASNVKYDGRTPLTIEAILSADRTSGAFQGVVGNIHNAGTCLAIQDGTWQFWCHDGSAYRRALSDDSVVSGEVVHLAGVYDGRTVRLYVNGIAQKSIEQMAGPHNAAPHPFIIGADPDNTGRGEHFFEGVFHSVRVSNTARYVRNFKSPGSFAADKDTIAVWKMDEGEGVLLRDASGNGNHARLNGAQWIDAEKK